jgi:GNAT superfamily N-acetyltransferase
VTTSIRLLKESDLVTADSILQSAFRRSESWRNDLQLFCELQPDGIFLACQHSSPAGMVAAINYSNFAYVGLMGVRQEFQKQGVGLTLMRHLLAWLEQHGVQQVLLDASSMGQPLYEKLNFTAFDKVYVLQRQTSQTTFQRPGETQFISQKNIDLITAIDMQVFGADRKRLLQALLEIFPKRGFLLLDEHNRPGGYLISQENRIGPWVMDDPARSELLLRAALSLPYYGPISAVVPGENVNAIVLLQQYGFEIMRVNRHMVRGPAVALGCREKIYAQASLSLG